MKLNEYILVGGLFHGEFRTDRGSQWIAYSPYNRSICVVRWQNYYSRSLFMYKIIFPEKEENSIPKRMFPTMLKALGF